MKQLLVVVACAVLLIGCSGSRAKRVAAQRTPVPVADTHLYDANGAVIERVPFRAGISSVTVENMAKQNGCTGGVGAGLMTAQGPVEVYRMLCENGQVYMARCELRQCKKM